MALFSKRKEEDPFNYEDNIIGWHDAIKSKLNKMRAVRYAASITEHNGVIVGVMPVIEDVEYLLNELEHRDRYLPVMEKMNHRRQSEWLSARLLLKEMLGVEKEIGYLTDGKPYLTDGTYQISISHTKGYVAVIASKTQAVAIDIEYLSPRVERIKDRFLSEEELANLDADEPLVHLLLHWSAKECLFKLLDEDAIEFKTQLHVSPFVPVIDKRSSFDASETRTGKGSDYQVVYLATAQYVLTYIVGARILN